MELHDIGPAKLFDTAGIDELGELGKKKLRKTVEALKARFRSFMSLPTLCIAAACC
jgi:hypothetical protein